MSWWSRKTIDERERTEARKLVEALQDQQSRLKDAGYSVERLQAELDVLRRRVLG